MANLLTRKMNSIQISSSILVFLIALTESIRVDWNTNKGPIVPPIPTEPPRPQLPYRNPAPVWEDQSEDSPNPNPYSYILPPPSRPRPPVDNYLRAPLYPHQPFLQSLPKSPNYGKILESPSNYQHNAVPGLAVQYVPNVGFKYNAVVPQKSYYLKENDIYDHAYEKPNGRYNAKLKKYKAYEEKLKQQQYPKQRVQQSNRYEFAIQPQQQLPFLQPPQQFRPNNFYQQQKLPFQQNPIPFNSEVNNQQQQQQQQLNIKRETQHPWNNQQQYWQSQYKTNLAQTSPQIFPNPTQQAFYNSFQTVQPTVSATTTTSTTTAAATVATQANQKNLGNNSNQS